MKPGRLDTPHHYRSLAEAERGWNKRPQDVLISNAPVVEEGGSFSGKLSELPSGITIMVKVGQALHFIRKMTSGIYKVVK